MNHSELSHMAGAVDDSTINIVVVIIIIIIITIISVKLPIFNKMYDELMMLMTACQKRQRCLLMPGFAEKNNEKLRQQK